MNKNFSKKEYEGFIIDSVYKTENNKGIIYFYGRLKTGETFITKNVFEPYFFIQKDDQKKTEKLINTKIEETELKDFSQKKVIKLIFDTQTELIDAKKILETQNIETFESDIKPEYKLIMDLNLLGSLKIIGKAINKGEQELHFENPEITKSNWTPSFNDLKILSLDIETSMNGSQLYSVSIVTNKENQEKVLIIGKKNLEKGIYCKDEQDLLEKFVNEINKFDPDIITGWNVIDFDLKILVDKIKNNKLIITRNKEQLKLRVTESFMMDSKAECEGRVILDGIHLLKSSFVKLDDYKLGTAAKEFTKSTKLIGDENKGQEIEDSYNENPQKLVNYNLMDSKLVLEILKNSGVLELTILRSRLTGMPLDRVRASIASFDSLYLRKLRTRNFVAPTTKFLNREERTTGGFVMDSNPGIYDFVIVCDFKSLYPSIMRTFNIDPLMFSPDCEDKNLIRAPNGACFKREKGIIPQILEELWDEREKATKRKDALTRQAIKISMNSMYGVLASPNCRFYNTKLANAITHFGHVLLKKTKQIIEQKKYKVIYGDTDSVFINVKAKNVEEVQEIGNYLQDFINAYFKENLKKEHGVESKIELEFEKTFKKFFLPRARGSEEGAKKRYAGLLVTNKTEKIEFTGLEFVRRDWTALSKKFQLSLLEKVFKEEPLDNFIKEFVKDLKKGKYDDLLIYRKALRKDMHEYTKTTPPHVKAARLLDKITTNIIDYVITTEGPQPIQKQTNNIDYNHYIEKQIKPLANSVLCFFDTTFDETIEGSQQSTLGNW